jgi:transcriptional regulator with XRE-family HTH domain
MRNEKLRVDWLSEQTGISKQSISNYRSGRVKPGLAYQKIIASVLNADIKDLF